MKKLYIFTLLLLVTTFVLSGTAGTAGWYREDGTENRIAIGSLEGRIVEEYEQDTVVMPGDEVSKVVRVENTGMADGLVRVRLEPVWSDTEEEASPEILGLDAGGENWKYDEETGFYYYLKVLKPGECTTPVMTGFNLDGPSVGNPYSNRPGRIIVYMEMVQALADGISLWGKDGTDPEIDYSAMTLIGEAEGTGVAFCGPEDGFVFEAEHGDLFRGFKELLPGESRVQGIVLKNSWEEGAEIFLRAESGEESQKESEPGQRVMLQSGESGDINRELLAELLEKHAAVNIYSGGSLIYSGPVWTSDNGGLYGGGISLGAFQPGEDEEIYVELTVDKAVDNEFMNLIGSVNWIFSASADEVPVPQTGDKALTPLLIVALCSGLGSVILASVKLIRERKHKRAAGAMLLALTAGVCAVLLAASGGPGGTLAFMTDAQTQENHITGGRLSLELKEPGFVPETVLAPEEAAVKDPYVTNTGTVAMLAYLRISIPLETVRLVGADKVTVYPPELTQLFSFEAGENWLLLAENRTENGTSGAVEYVYGYLKVLEPGTETEPLFETVTMANILEGELPQGTLMNIPVEALGLQADNIGEDLAFPDRLVYGYNTFLAGAGAGAEK